MRQNERTVALPRENAIISTQLPTILTVCLLTQDPPGLRYNHPGIIDIQFRLVRLDVSRVPSAYSEVGQLRAPVDSPCRLDIGRRDVNFPPIPSSLRGKVIFAYATIARVIKRIEIARLKTPEWGEGGGGGVKSVSYVTRATSEDRLGLLCSEEI